MPSSRSIGLANFDDEGIDADRPVVDDVDAVARQKLVVRIGSAAVRDFVPIDRQDLIPAAVSRRRTRHPYRLARHAADSLQLGNRIQDRLVPRNRKPLHRPVSHATIRR